MSRPSWEEEVTRSVNALIDYTVPTEDELIALVNPANMGLLAP